MGGEWGIRGELPAVFILRREFRVCNRYLNGIRVRRDGGANMRMSVLQGSGRNVTRVACPLPFVRFSISSALGPSVSVLHRGSNNEMYLCDSH